MPYIINSNEQRNRIIVGISFPLHIKLHITNMKKMTIAANIRTTIPKPIVSIILSILVIIFQPNPTAQSANIKITAIGISIKNTNIRLSIFTYFSIPSAYQAPRIYFTSRYNKDIILIACWRQPEYNVMTELRSALVCLN